jgi:hypothetical protein
MSDSQTSKHHVTRPRTQTERWEWLLSDALLILRSPLDYRAEEVALARDIVEAA